MRAAADRNDIGIALKQADGVERYAEPFRDALCEARLVALAARQRTDRELDAAFQQHRDCRVFARRPAGRLDVIGKSNAAQPPASLGLVATLCETFPVGEP